jgi:hypothetical protein
MAAPTQVTSRAVSSLLHGAVRVSIASRPFERRHGPITLRRKARRRAAADDHQRSGGSFDGAVHLVGRFICGSCEETPRYRPFLFLALWCPSHDGRHRSRRRPIMQPTTVIFALGVTLALVVLVMLVWRWRVRRLNGDNPEERYRRDIRALQRGRWTRAAERHSEDVWSSGAAPDSPHSRAKKAGATLATGLVAGGCGGCGGCGCGG